MNISPVSFGRAVKVNATPEVARMLVREANVKTPSTELQKFAKSIFPDTNIHRAKVVAITPDEVYIYSGKEAMEQYKVSTELKQKIKENEDFIKQLPDRITRQKRKEENEVENYARLNYAIFKMRSLVEDGLSGRPKTEVDISTRTVKSQFFGIYDEIESVVVSTTKEGKTEKLAYQE